MDHGARRQASAGECIVSIQNPASTARVYHRPKPFSFLNDPSGNVCMLLQATGGRVFDTVLF